MIWEKKKTDARTGCENEERRVEDKWIKKKEWRDKAAGRDRERGESIEEEKK